MQAAEIAANIIESLIISEFLTRFLEPKNKRLVIIKIMGCFVLLFAEITFVPMLGLSEMVQIAGTLAIAMIYSVVFLKGEIYKKIFVVFISCITILLINITVLTVMKEALKTDMDTLTTSADAVRTVEGNDRAFFLRIMCYEDRYSKLINTIKENWELVDSDTVKGIDLYKKDGLFMIRKVVNTNVYSLIGDNVEELKKINDGLG